jgi:hypothetical protein
VNHATEQEKHTGKTTPIQNTHQTKPIIYEFIVLYWWYYISAGERL